MTITTEGFELHPWQSDAADAWADGFEGHPYRGTLEIVTGGGKTLIALECIARASQREPDLKAAVVVPTEALARQWRERLVKNTSLDGDSVGLLGAGRKGTFEQYRVLVAVINTAAQRLPELARDAQPLMLVVDECHRAGAPKYSRVLTTPAAFRLGLSATPDREELDEQGEPLRYDEQAVGRALGGVVYQFSLKSARLTGWLPEYELHHHGIALSDDERREYDRLSRRVDDAGDRLRAQGHDTSRARGLAGRQDMVGDAARAWVQLTAQRKDLLYRAEERGRVAARLVRDSLDGATEQTPRIILFHERVQEAVALHATLEAQLPGVRVELEHSKLPAQRRQEALRAFASGQAPVLVSVKSLIEGIDVPEADTGISVASTSAVRQRVQSLGRVLRRVVSETGVAKRSTMHLVYVADTVDDVIYGKADWADLTGADTNRYWTWPYGALEPVPAARPPRTPLPTEEQVWESWRGHPPATPVPWTGDPYGLEYSVKTNGAVHNESGTQIANPQGVATMVEEIRGKAGGRFRVTPVHRLVLIWQPGEQGQFWLAGKLDEPFRAVDAPGGDAAAGTGLANLVAGDPYLGRADKAGGTLQVSQRGGGVIQRRVPGGAVVALTAGTDQPKGEANARDVITAWEHLGHPFSRFFVSSDDIAWYEAEGGRYYIAHVEGGFAWPPEGE